ASRPPGAPGPAATPSPPAAAPAVSPAHDAGPAWQFELGEFALKDASISAEDRRTKPVAKVLIAPLSIKVTGASLDLAKPLSVALDTKINDTGSLNVAGQITPQPMEIG